MEKEITAQQGQVCLNFFFPDRELSAQGMKDFGESLNLMALAMDTFKNEQFKLNENSFILNITLCDDEKIKELNLEFRGKDKITDVLSFPLQENLRAGEFDQFIPEVELGDIYVCHSVCEAQAQEFSLSYQEEFIHLCVHGFLHVCGYDHEISQVEEILMESLEEKIIKKISEIKKGSL